jgi:hypothetical protein
VGVTAYRRAQRRYKITKFVGCYCIQKGAETLQNYKIWWVLLHTEGRRDVTKLIRAFIKNYLPQNAKEINTYVLTFADRLCGLVVRVSGYRYRGLGFDPRRYQIF